MRGAPGPGLLGLPCLYLQACFIVFRMHFPVAMLSCNISLPRRQPEKHEDELANPGACAVGAWELAEPYTVVLLSVPPCWAGLGCALPGEGPAALNKGAVKSASCSRYQPLPIGVPPTAPLG